jgi:hypothetical protein
MRVFLTALGQDYTPAGAERTPPASGRPLPGARNNSQRERFRREIVRLLLDAGEDPNRYNPVGGHSHTTPLHQAAGGGHWVFRRGLTQDVNLCRSLDGGEAMNTSRCVRSSLVAVKRPASSARTKAK